jgi:hypothetical protein
MRGALNLLSARLTWRLPCLQFSHNLIKQAVLPFGFGAAQPYLPQQVNLAYNGMSAVPTNWSDVNSASTVSRLLSPPPPSLWYGSTY